MKKLFSLNLVGMLAVSGLSAKVKLSVLYVGGTANMDPILMSPGSVDSVALAASVKERMAHFTKFLKKNFTNVKSIEGKDYTPEMSAAYDVTVFDGRPVPFMKGDRMRGERDSYLPESFDCAAVMIGHMSEELGRSLGNKNDWYCLCLDNYALGMKNEHPVFNGPFKVDMTTEMRPTAAPALEVAEMMGESLPKEMPMLLMHPNWTEEENASGNCRIGMVSRPGGYLDSPDTEVISGGLCGKSIDAVAIGRHGNLFHFGFAADPERLTPAGRAILLNSIVYASEFNGQKLIARKMNEGIVTRDHLPMTKWACTRKANDYINETNLTFRQMIDSVHAVAVEKKNKGEELSRFEAIYLDMPQMPPVVKKSFGQYLKERNPKLYEVFGTDEAAYADYYEKNAPYMRPDLRGYELVIDPEVQALGIPNNDIRLLDKAIELMEQGNPDGKTILERYTLKRFATPAEWHNWLNIHRPRMFFTEAGGYLWLVNEKDANDYSVLAAEAVSAQAVAPVPVNNDNLTTDKDNPVVLTARIDTRADGKKEYVLTMKIHPGYHTYARLDPADPYILTTIEMEYPAGVEADGDMIMPPFQPTSNATSYYVDTVEFRQPLKGNGKGEIGAKIRYQACDHSECKLPVTTTVKVTL